LPQEIMRGFEWKWALGIGGAGVACFVATWAIGWNAGGLGAVQVACALPILAHFVGYGLFLGGLFRSRPETSYAEAVKAGGLVAVGVAAVAALGQALYLAYLDPGWTERLVEMVRVRYAEAGYVGDELEEIVRGARSTYGFASSVTQAGVGGLVTGLLFCAGLAGFLKWRANR
jgi:hypothetical protein